MDRIASDDERSVVARGVAWADDDDSLYHNSLLVD
jgi:hypothetical protein